jgi:DNA-binding CsgD family transcriptional regulator
MSPATFGELRERRTELEAMAEAVRAACRDEGNAILVEGAAGIGKTALLAAASHDGAQAGMTVLSARAGDLERDFAWGVVRQLFDAQIARAPAARRAELLRAAAGLAGPALGLEATGDEPAEASFSTLHGLYWLTVNLAERGPVALVVDDLHWADSPSLRFLAYLTPRLAGLPVLLVAALRPPGTEPGTDGELLERLAAEPAAMRLRPRPLSRAACAELVQARFADQAAEELCVASHELSGGNPFLLRELVAELADEGIAPDADAVDHLRRMTPAAISRMVLLRLARLSGGAIALARAVAMLGTEAELRRARALADLGPTEAADAAVALIRSGILTGEDVLVFVHPLVRSAVYEDLTGPERSRWHRRAAQLLDEQDAPLGRLAAHLLASAPDGDPWTVERLRAGAAEARADGAPEVAADYLRRALAEPPSDAVRRDVLFELGNVEAGQDLAAACRHLEKALAASDGGRQRAAGALALGEALALCGRLGEAIDVLVGGIAELCEDPSELRAPLEAALLGAARWEPSAQRLRHDLVETIERRAARGAALGRQLHGQLAVEAAARGVERDAAVRHAREALAGFEELSNAGASIVPEAALVLAFADHADEARTAADAWLALTRRRVWPLGAALGSTTAALAALYRGSVSEAVANARGAVGPSAEIRLAPISVAFLVEALIERGEIALALRELSDRGLDGELPDGWAPTPLLLARGRLHAAAGDHDAAIRDLLAAGERAEAWGISNPAMYPWRSSGAVSLAIVGRRDEAAELAHAEVELACRWGAPRAIGVALRACGVVDGTDRGLELLHAAAAGLERAPAPLEHARALTDLGAGLRRAGRRAEARDHLRRGLDIAHRLGGIAVAERARQELAIAGARPRRDALRGRDALTPSELRVAQLAADGQTNRQIAEALFVTLRTVETHLTSTYAKLGIESRRELASALEAAADARA